MNILENGIYQSDCLVLLERIESERFSLAYLDPPALTQITKKPIKKGKGWVEEAEGLRGHLSLIMKVVQQVRRILNPQGNLFFHSEPYLAGDYRQILNEVFGRDNFRLEIILPRLKTKITRPSGPKIEHDIILHYSKGDHPIYNPQFKHLVSDNMYSQTDEGGKYRFEKLTTHISRPSLQFEWNGFKPLPGESWRYSKERLDELYKAGKISLLSQGQRPRLKVYLKESKVEVGSIWDDILSVSKLSDESLNFQAQKPLMLLNRLINMGSNKGDFVLDPFCGSGTSLISAQMNDRRWLGCDISTEAYAITLERYKEELKLQAERDFKIGDQVFLEQNFPILYATYHETIRVFDKQIQSAKFILNQPISIEETRHHEFKEIGSTTNPVDRIKDHVEEYACAFLNSEGGQILWGIRDRDRTICGVKLNNKQRDEVRRVVTEKLHTIQPPIAVTTFRVNLHPVYQGFQAIPDLFVVQLEIPTVSNRSLYYTSSGKSFVRTDGANKELKGLLLQAEILKRFSIQQQ